MGKQGPCCHCGVTSTPLWRNGPHDKPVLCNACGSRWRTKGTLANYYPNHSRASTAHEFQDSKHNRGETSKRTKSYYTKSYNEGTTEDRYSTAVYHPYLTCFEEDSRSSSGSALSVSESCVQFGYTDEISGPSPFNISDVQIPLRKRTKIKRPSLSPIEKLTQDLVTILRQQGSSYLSECSQEVLLFDGEELSYNSEIGHGSVLLKPPILCKEEESEASSHIPGNKLVHDTLQPLSNESSNSAKEVSCLTSDVTGTEISKLAKQSRDSPCLHSYEGKAFKIPKVEVMGTSGEECVDIQAPSSCSNILSASSQSLNSDVYNFMGTTQVGAELG